MKLYSCPICGHSPIIETLDFEFDSNCIPKHKFTIHCSNREGCPLSREIPMFQVTDISRPREDVYTYLCDTWNEECVKINELILHRYDSKEW